tara:strand:- start:4 stop:237 length:234 start_codon:yes stop_codon:yes gene_type:complete
LCKFDLLRKVCGTYINLKKNTINYWSTFFIEIAISTRVINSAHLFQKYFSNYETVIVNLLSEFSKNLEILIKKNIIK